MLPAGAGPRSTIRRGGQQLVRWDDPWLPVGRRNRLALASERRALEVHETGEHMSPGAWGHQCSMIESGDSASRRPPNV